MQVFSHKFAWTEVRHRSCSLSRNPYFCSRAWGHSVEFVSHPPRKLRWIPGEIPTAKSSKSFSKKLSSFFFRLFRPTEILASMKCLYSCTSTEVLVFSTLSFSRERAGGPGECEQCAYVAKANSIPGRIRKSWYQVMGGDPSPLPSSGETISILGSVWGSPVWDGYPRVSQPNGHKDD